MSLVEYTQRGVCAQCGRTNGGLFHDSRWGHEYRCCSDDCGRLLEQRITSANRNPLIRDIDQQIAKLRVDRQRLWDALMSQSEEF